MADDAMDIPSWSDFQAARHRYLDRLADAARDGLAREQARAVVATGKIGGSEVRADGRSPRLGALSFERILEAPS